MRYNRLEQGKRSAARGQRSPWRMVVQACSYHSALSAMHGGRRLELQVNMYER